jgi:hypothetical protein
MSFWWIPTISIVGSFAVMIIVVLSVAQTRQRRAELQAQVQAKLIDRFSSAPELIDFLKSETGQQFVSGVKATQAAAVSRRMLGGIRASVFLAILGLGFLVLWPLANEQGFMFPGVILLALGAGFFVSTMVSVKLSRQWRLTDQEHSGDVR